MQGHDVVGQAKTGSGKTASFALPILEMLERSADLPQALILAPTRELVQQIVVETEKMAVGQNVRIRGLYGGEPIVRQLRSLERGVDIVVGTPGRIMDLLERRALDFSDVYHVVLDEADRMLDIGFRDDIERILRRVPDPHQTLLLSATLSEEILFLSRKHMHHPIELNLSRDELSVESIRQYYITVDHDRKIELLQHLLNKEMPRQCIVFTRTKRGADKLHEVFSKRLKSGRIACIHGDLPQRKRDRVIRELRAGHLRLLIATDVVGRGIDISGISHIINYDIPEYCDDYVHRVGRTGRLSSDQQGRAVTFVTLAQGGELTNIEKRINTVLPEYQVEGFDAFRRRERTSRKITRFGNGTE